MSFKKNFDLPFCVLLLIFFASQSVFGQKLNLVDSITKEPIAFAHLVYLRQGKQIGGLYTNRLGQAEVVDLNPKDSILISCLGYGNKFVSKQSLEDTLFLMPKVYDLEEVLIYSRGPLKSVYLGTNREKKSGPDRSFVGHKSLVLIANPYKKHKLIKEFYFEKSRLHTKGEYTARVIFYKNENGQPGEKINYEKIIIVKRKTKRKIWVNVEEANLAFPLEGLFVGLERLGCFEKNDQSKSCQLATRAIYDFKKDSCIGKVFTNHPYLTDTFFDVNNSKEKSFCYLPVYGLVVYE